MDLLTTGHLFLDPDLRTRIQAACLLLGIRFTDDAVRKVLFNPDVSAACTSEPLSAAGVPDAAIIAALDVLVEAPSAGEDPPPVEAEQP